MVAYCLQNEKGMKNFRVAF